jgi:hypothetical protein
MLLLLEFKHVRQSAPADYKGASLSGTIPCPTSIADGQTIGRVKLTQAWRCLHATAAA